MFNPLAHCVQAAQAVIVNHAWPSWSALLGVALLSLLLSILAVRLYLQHGADMQDEL
jgi:ABC-type polysaccharide/polyol phosphate export permease